MTCTVHDECCWRESVANFAQVYIVSSIETMKPSSYSNQYSELRKWLKAKREEQGITLREAAGFLDRHHSIIGKIEQNRKRIDVAEFVEYCEALGVDPHEGLDVFIDTRHLSSGRTSKDRHSG